MKWFIVLESDEQDNYYDKCNKSFDSYEEALIELKKIYKIWENAGIAIPYIPQHQIMTDYIPAESII